VGEKILGDVGGFELARVVARFHHENFDGSGYPDRAPR
jgi:response regulator RpfG family c-di-GMP phosphodiesterase